MKTLIKRILAILLICSLVVPVAVSYIPAKAEVAPEYTIKFNSNDGNGIYLKLKKARNGSIPVPEMTITHDGFGFIGWSYDKLSTNPEYIVCNFFKKTTKTITVTIVKKKG